MSNQDYKTEFKYLDNQILSEFGKDQDYNEFLNDPNHFRSLLHVTQLLKNAQTYQLEKSAFRKSEIYMDLQAKRRQVNGIIEKVVLYQHGGLNLTVDTMNEVVKSYTKGREEIRHLRRSLLDSREVLTSKKSSNSNSLRKLWLRKSELEETLRIIKNIEFLKDAPPRVQKCLAERRYLTAVITIKKADALMFHEDLIDVVGLQEIRDLILELKESVVDKILTELQDAIYGIDSIDVTSENVEDNEALFISDSKSDVTSAVGIMPDDTGWTSTVNNEISTSGRDALLSDEAELSNDVSLEQAESLLGLSEVFESGVAEPAKTGLLFIRLLVRAISELQKEDDFERLLFDNLASRFRARVIRHERQVASTKLSSVLSADTKNTKGAKEGDGDITTSYLSLAYDKVALINMRVFSGYVASLLRNSVNSLRCTSYVLKLLNLSREWRKYIESQREKEEEEEYEDEEEIEDNTQDDGSQPDNSDAAEAPTRNSKAASVRTRRVSKSLVSFSYSLQDHNRNSVRNWWTELEEEMCWELKAHLKEPDVEEISDSKFKRPNAMATEVHEGGIEQPIVTPTAKLATPLYKYVTAHHETVSKLLLTENYYSGDSQDRDGSSRSTLKGSGLSGELRSAGLTVLQHLAVVQEKSKTVYPAVLLSFLNSFVETDLLPIAQSYANSEMREIQLNPLLFNHSLQTKAKVKPGSNTQQNNGLEPQINTVTFLTQSLTLNSATLKCSRASQLLFGYWLELASHREMVATILDRLVRGFVACAKEERDNVTWKSLGSEEKFRGPIVLALNQDTLLVAYRRKLYRGKANLDELITSKLKSLKSENTTQSSGGVSTDLTAGVMNELNKDLHEESANFLASAAIPTRRLSKLSVSSDPQRDRSATTISQTSGKIASSDQLSMWASFFGSIGTTVNYPVTREKTVRDFSQLETVASILTGCDWLSFELYKYCDFAVGKFLKRQEARVVNDHSVENKRASRRMAEEARQALSQDSIKPNTSSEGMHESLWHITAGATKELQRVAENCLAFLKCETQVVCFLHLHQLANIVSLKAVFVRRDQTTTKVATPVSAERRDATGVNAATSNSNGDTNEAELVISELIQHLKQVYGIMKPVLPREMIAAITLPLCTLIPRIIMRCIQHLISPHTGGFISGGLHHAVASDASGMRKYQYVIDCAKYLRMAISTQQLVTSLLESLQLEPGALRLCSDQLIEEIERIRKYLNLVDLPPKELKNYLRDHSTAYTSLEYITVWDCMVARSDEKQSTFEEYFSTLVLPANQK